METLCVILRIDFPELIIGWKVLVYASNSCSPYVKNYNGGGGDRMDIYLTLEEHLDRNSEGQAVTRHFSTQGKQQHLLPSLPCGMLVRTS